MCLEMGQIHVLILSQEVEFQHLVQHCAVGSIAFSLETNPTVKKTILFFLSSSFRLVPQNNHVPKNSLVQSVTFCLQRTAEHSCQIYFLGRQLGDHLRLLLSLGPVSSTSFSMRDMQPHGDSPVFEVVVLRKPKVGAPITLNEKADGKLTEDSTSQLDLEPSFSAAAGHSQIEPDEVGFKPSNGLLSASE